MQNFTAVWYNLIDHSGGTCGFKSSLAGMAWLGKEMTDGLNNMYNTSLLAELHVYMHTEM